MCRFRWFKVLVSVLVHCFKLHQDGCLCSDTLLWVRAVLCLVDECGLFRSTMAFSGFCSAICIVIIYVANALLFVNVLTN